MKHVIKYMLLIAFLHNCMLLNAQQDCLDNSYHLKQAYDNKNYHYVGCTCPCSEYKNFTNRGQCMQCKHYHVPKNWMVISGDKVVMQIQQTKPVQSTEQIAVSPETRAVIKTMIANYKK